MLEMQMTGYLGRDAEVRKTDSGRMAIGFTIAHTEKYKNSEGVVVEDSTWVNCTIWRNQGDSVKIAEYLKKGQQVFVAGFPSVRSYVSKEGEAKASLNLVVDLRRFSFLGKNTDNDQPATQNAKPATQNPRPATRNQEPERQDNSDLGPNRDFDQAPDDLPW